MTSLFERVVCYKDKYIIQDSHLQVHDQPKYGLVLVVVTVDCEDQDVLNEDPNREDDAELYTSRTCYVFDRSSFQLVTKFNVSHYDQKGSYICLRYPSAWVLFNDDENEIQMGVPLDLQKLTLHVFSHNDHFCLRMLRDEKFVVLKSNRRVFMSPVTKQYVGDKQVMSYCDLVSDCEWRMEWSIKGTDLINIRSPQQSIYGISLRSLDPILYPMHSPDGTSILIRWSSFDPPKQWIQFVNLTGPKGDPVMGPKEDLAGQSFSEVSFLTLKQSSNSYMIIPPICLNQDLPWIVCIVFQRDSTAFQRNNTIELYDKKPGTWLETVSVPRDVEHVELLPKGFLLFGKHDESNNTVEWMTSDLLWRTQNKFVLAEHMHRLQSHYLFERALFRIICSFMY